MNSPNSQHRPGRGPVGTLQLDTCSAEIERLHGDFVEWYCHGSPNAFEPGTFAIRIEAVEGVELREERALVRYDEWQDTPEGTNGRRSTVVFGPRADGVEWRYLQETWLEPPA